jgi:hypothetical protein
VLYQLSYVPLLTCNKSVAEVHIVADIPWKGLITESSKQTLKFGT